MRGKGWTHMQATWTCAFPKRKFQSLPSIRGMSWQCLLMPWTKIEHCSVNSRPFELIFSGINCFRCPVGAGIFSYLISDIFVYTLFEWANKIMLMWANCNIMMKYEWWGHLGGYLEGGDAGGCISHTWSSSQIYFDGRGSSREVTWPNHLAHQSP